MMTSNLTLFSNERGTAVGAEVIQPTLRLINVRAVVVRIQCKGKHMSYRQSYVSKYRDEIQVLLWYRLVRTRF